MKYNTSDVPSWVRDRFRHPPKNEQRDKGVDVLPPDNPKELKLGWTIHEEIGIVVINDYATGKVQVVSENRWDMT